VTAIGTPFQTNSESSYASYAVGIVRGNNSLFTLFTVVHSSLAFCEQQILRIAQDVNELWFFGKP
jgi:hypothetical protein